MSRKPSELILGDHGNLYHLDLCRGEVAETVLTVGDPGRVSKVSGFFDSVELKRSHREFTTHTGRIGEKRITVMSTGMGLDNIDIFWNELDALFNVDLQSGIPLEDPIGIQVIRLGTSGSIHPSVSVDSILVSQGALSCDSLWDFYPDADPFRIPAENHEDLWFFPSSLSLSGDELKTGITYTAPGFYGPQGRALRLTPAQRVLPQPTSDWIQKFGPVVNLEMETAGLLGLGSLLGHQVASVNAILAERGSGRFSNDPNRTIERMITRVLEMIQ
ncbi:MAG: phosphorylase [Bacteroidota bacterium]|nr:phosphorylase [Bacteroidota bacterium]